MKNLEIKRVGVALKTSNSDAVELGRQLVVEIERLGLEAVVDRESAEGFERTDGPERSALAAEVDLVVVLGGDGTLLSVTRNELGGTPILGVNMGTLGFLTEHSAEMLFPMLHRTLEGEVEIQKRERLEVEVKTPGRKAIVNRALNDVVINKSALARMLVLSVHVDGQFLSRFKADGLIVATPTGSTAYSLSAGGPILYPTLNVIVVTPICPHTLTNRPIALSMDSIVEIRLETLSEEVYLTLDGQEGFPLTPRDMVSIQRCEEPIHLVSNAQNSYFQILHRKLKWGERSG